MIGVEVSRGERRVIRVAGEIDYGNVGELNAALDEAVRECPRGFIVDLSDTEYMDSAGVQAILSAYVRISDQGGGLWLVLRNPNIREILALIHLESFPGLHICDDITSAEQAIPGCDGA